MVSVLAALALLAPFCCCKATEAPAGARHSCCQSQAPAQNPQHKNCPDTDKCQCQQKTFEKQELTLKAPGAEYTLPVRMVDTFAPVVFAPDFVFQSNSPPASKGGLSYCRQLCVYRC